ncbi:hypothetical protein CO178_00540 [candidate division WWE3 bacterium CG_4_9_14_3_um_filter_34_6]|uniref:Glycosyltransferase 2-like domain-containing protein n=1 Tax=candidate division WWE3 bacterium CG_4_9_14_3_um_filter_34_6 TaxID=1975079 RepID=A0A2M7X547_UNCKA|nr:MAG: hypothetical protein CO178_00540 [candidate division WWE3 bacterium CG_4_9_14_3_um_filter_34_6]
MDISIIVTVYNNSSTLIELYDGLSSVFGELDRSYELIIINDGSADDSWKIISSLQKKDPHVKAIDFRRHYGESAALQAGFDLSKGNYVLTIGASLENDPKDLLKLFEKVSKKDNDMVIGIRQGRYDGRALSKMKSKFAHWIIKYVAKTKFSDVTSPVRAMEREVVQNIRLFGDGYMYLPVLATLYGAKFEEVSIKHYKPRASATFPARVNFFKFIFDIIFLKFFVSATTPPFNLTPMRLFGGLGSLSALLGSIGGIYLTYQKAFLGLDIGTRPLLILSVLLLILGAMFVVFGVLGEIIIRSYFETQDKLTYTTREKLVA